MHIKFQKNGVTKEVKVGFSWTTLFFGWWVPLLRGMVGHALLGIVTFNLASLYYMFAINRLYAQKLAADGWVVHEQDRSYAFAKWNIR